MTAGRLQPFSPSSRAALVPDHLGPVHVVVEDSRARSGPSSSASAWTASRSSGSSMTRDVDAGLLQAADAAAVRERDDTHVVAVAVETRHQRVDVLLRPTVGAGGHDFDDADAAAVDRLPVDREVGAGLAQAVVGSHLSCLPRPGDRSAERARARSASRPRPTRTCTARRRAGNRGGFGRARWLAGCIGRP